MECKECHKIFYIEDEDLMKDDTNWYDQLYDRKLCRDCNYRYNDNNMISIIKDVFDCLDDGQREKLIPLLKIALSGNPDDRDDLMRIINDNFNGFEGLQAWGLW